MALQLGVSLFSRRFCLSVQTLFPCTMSDTSLQVVVGVACHLGSTSARCVDPSEHYWWKTKSQTRNWALNVELFYFQQSSMDLSFPTHCTVSIVFTTPRCCPTVLSAGRVTAFSVIPSKNKIYSADSCSGKLSYFTLTRYMIPLSARWAIKGIAARRCVWKIFREAM